MAGSEDYLHAKLLANPFDILAHHQQKEVLRLGLNFAPAPTKLPLVDTITAVEEGAQQLKEEDAEDLWRRVCGILRHAKPPKDNLTKEQRNALKELRGLED